VSGGGGDGVDAWVEVKMEQDDDGRGGGEAADGMEEREGGEGGGRVKRKLEPQSERRVTRRASIALAATAAMAAATATATAAATATATAAAAVAPPGAAAPPQPPTAAATAATAATAGNAADCKPIVQQQQPPRAAQPPATQQPRTAAAAAAAEPAPPFAGNCALPVGPTPGWALNVTRSFPFTYISAVVALQQSIGPRLADRPASMTLVTLHAWMSKVGRLRLGDSQAPGSGGGQPKLAMLIRVVLDDGTVGLDTTSFHHVILQSKHIPLFSQCGG
jgi:hypothetical protein